MAVVTFTLSGFCIALVYEAGPLHLYDTPPAEVRLSVLLTHTGPLLSAMATGDVFIVTAVDAVFEQPLTSVTVT